LLVSSARQQNGLLLGAHGVAPARNSLTQRVQRVLDRSLNRSVGGGRWSAAVVVGITALTVPLITLQFTGNAPAFPGSAPFASDDDGDVIEFELRAPPRKRDSLPEAAQETTDPATAAGESAGAAAPVNSEKGL
jgi:hypothetical protein